MRLLRTTFLSIALVLPMVGGLAASCQADGPFSSFSDWFYGTKSVKASEWWKENKHLVEFVPGKGYSVEGQEGFFDRKGRPIDQPVDLADRMLDESKESVGLLPELDPRVAYGKMKSAVGRGPDESLAKEAFAQGEALFQEKQYASAARRYEEAVNRAPGSSVEEDALFMLAESYYFGDRYLQARDAYNALVEKYSNTRFLDKLIEREWNIARYWELYENHSPDWTMTPNWFDKKRPQLDTLGHAVKTYENIRLNDPTGPRADDAIMATANIEFRRNRYDEADYNYSLLRREYPRSEHQFDAHVLGLQAKLRKYQGPDYDGAVLEEAKQLHKQLKTQFAGQLGPEERERMRTVKLTLHREVARRDMRMAQYYDDTKHFGAAKYYYAQVSKKYPDSDLAQFARERFAQIAGEPERPAKRLAWFVDIFPESSERSAMAGIPVLEAGETRLARDEGRGTSSE